MKSIIISILFIACSTPRYLFMSDDAQIRNVTNRIIIKGDSNVVNFNYMRIYGVSKNELDSLINELDTIQ